jgi:hypothetical protein
MVHGRAAAVPVLVAAAVLVVAGELPSMGTDAHGNVHIATTNTTTQRIFLNGVDVLGELSRLSAALEAKATGPTTTTTTTTPSTTPTTSTTPAVVFGGGVPGGP